MDIFNALFIMFIWGIVFMFSLFSGLIFGSVFEFLFGAKIFSCIRSIIGLFAFICFVAPFFRENERESVEELAVFLYAYGQGKKVWFAVL